MVAMEHPPLPIPSPPPPHPDSARSTRGIRRCLPLATKLTGISYRVASVRRSNSGYLIANVGSQLTGGHRTPPVSFRDV
jgi:hypothetical protein